MLRGGTVEIRNTLKKMISESSLHSMPGENKKYKFTKHFGGGRGRGGGGEGRGGVEAVAHLAAVLTQGL